jgi:anti-anti-sigma factor
MVFTAGRLGERNGGMAIQNWSDDITVAELADDPQFTDELTMLTDSLEKSPRHVVLNFAAVGFINSSDVAKLLRLRKVTMQQQRRLILCEVNNQVWGIFLVTGLDKIFDFTNDIATALASVQLGTGGGGGKR